MSLHTFFAKQSPYKGEMADVTHPETGNRPHKDASDLRRLELRESATGEKAFYPFIILAALLIITPIGKVALLTSVLGLLIFALGAALTLHLSEIVLLRSVHKALAESAVFQRLLRKPTVFVEAKTTGRRHGPHWITSAPYDIFPKTIIAVLGIAIISSAGSTGLAQTLAAASLLLSIGLLWRSVFAMICGGCLISVASILPLLSA